MVAARVDGLFRPEGYCLCDGARLMKTDGLFRLWQNYPNPFNPATEIRYPLAEDGVAVLAVRDALGREVVRLVDGWRMAGVHGATFDARALPDGVYYYTLHSGRYFDAKKMVLIR